jgi:thiol:disulfide interchange protein DsbD
MLFRVLILSVLLTAAQVSTAQSFTERFSNIFAGSSANDEILSPDVAFTFESDVDHPERISLQWRVEDGYYLYRDKFKFTISEGSAEINQSLVNIPIGKSKQDPAFGQVDINTGDFNIGLPLQRAGNTESSATLEVHYQGCKDESVCYPPIVKQLAVILPSFISSAEAATVEEKTSASQPKQLSEQDAITKRLKDGSLLLNIFAFFGFGLLLSLTPCVFPMIPILSGIIVGQGNTITTTRAFSLSLFYVLAMALTYAVLGIIAGSFHFNLQAAFQNIWVISLFSLIFVLLALSMFGFYQLQLPAAMQSRLTSASNNQQEGTLHGAALMGALSAIIVGPCVAPPLAGALLYISQTGNALLGGLALFAMGLGFGVPLLLIGCSAGSLLPKAGAWMDTIKQVFGVIMLAVAVWFMERVLPAEVSLLLWATLIIVSSVYMGALDRLDANASWSKLWKGLGLVLLVYGVILVIGAASGGSNIYKPLQGLSMMTGAKQSGAKQFHFKSIKSLDDLNREITAASEQDKFVMLDFYADWCVVCKEMEAYTFSNAQVLPLLNEFILLQADVTENDELDRELLKEFDIYGPPAILFFGNDRQERQSYRLVGFVDAANFARHLKEVKATVL